MANALLIRTNTAPTFPSSSNRAAERSSHQHNAMSAPRTSHLLGSSGFAGSSASLSSLASSASTVIPVPSSNGGPIVATGNIINQKADASRSLYQICISLKSRLSQVPEFQPFLDTLDPSDPVDPLWNLFRTGYPLLLIYNALKPENELKVEDNNASEAKKSKIAIFKFIQACMKDLKLSPADTFVITDLMGNDTTGFVKVTQVVNYVLDLAEAGGHLLQPLASDSDAATPVAGTQMSYRDHIVKELVDTERKYVQDLENLHGLKKTLEEKGNIPGDTVHSIFLNINAILDFQRRFLIRVETENSKPAAMQRWGTPFCSYETAFDIYQPFISNQRKAAAIANQIFDKIQQAGHPVADDFNTLDGFLLKPMQRLVKYPLLLKDLIKKTDDHETKEDLIAGCEAADRFLHKANEAVNRDLLDEAVDDLVSRVDDWKSHKVEQFGRLILHGVYGVLTGKADQEKDYEIFLFDCILLCCKEKKDRTRSQGPKTKSKGAKLQLKGRIFMNNVTDIVSLSKPGSHSVQIWWKGDPGVENFTIKFLNEETMKKWAVCLETQRKENAPRASMSSELTSSDFAWTSAHASSLENPYLQNDDDDDDYGPATAPATFSASGSVNSMRQRSGTMDSQHSLAGIARAPPPRFPLPAPPGSLSVQTSGGQSPGLRGGDSYFSPTADSPASSRTSTTSGIFPGPPYQFPPKTSNPQQWDENSRYTAPAMPRAPSRDGTPPSSRHPRGPSLPALASAGQSAAQQQRSRSYSTPDAQVPGMQRQRHPSQSHVPNVPSIPSHLHPAHDPTLARSQSGSPRNDLPIRTNTSSPGRGHHHSGSLGGSLSQFPSQPMHGRQGTPSSSGSIRDPAHANIRTVSPAIGSGAMPGGGDLPMPTQLKVRVNCDAGNYVTLVVGFNITYQSLIDRIDAKLGRFMNTSIGKGQLKLRYQDEDGDFVTIESDDDIQIAFQEWREGMRNMYNGGVGEIELFCSGEASA